MSEFRIIHPTKNIISREEETRKWELINYLALGTSFFFLKDRVTLCYTIIIIPCRQIYITCIVIPGKCG